MENKVTEDKPADAFEHLAHYLEMRTRADEYLRERPELHRLIGLIHRHLPDPDANKMCVEANQRVWEDRYILPAQSKDLVTHTDPTN